MILYNKDSKEISLNREDGSTMGNTETANKLNKHFTTIGIELSESTYNTHRQNNHKRGSTNSKRSRRKQRQWITTCIK